MLPKACEQPYACLRAWYPERTGNYARRLAAVEPCHELL
jgi:hypothetical protein